MTERRQAVVAELMLEVSCLRDETEALRNKVATMEANPQVGTCCICGSAIWHKEARITDERGTFHPICAIKSELATLQKLAGEMAQLLTQDRCFMCLGHGHYIAPYDRVHDEPRQVECEMCKDKRAALTKYRTLNPVPDSGK